MTYRLIKQSTNIEYIPKYALNREKIIEALRILKDAKLLPTSYSATKSS
ncbi:hypothetical protein [Paenibacillus sp. WLX2291]